MQNKSEQMKLDNSLDAMIQRVTDIKTSINQFLWKLDHEHETLNWPSVLDSFALLSSQINSFHKLLSKDSMAPLKSYVFIPTQLNQERDVELEKLTEGRVAAFNHEVVPDYLRTKPEIDVEKKVKTCSEKAGNLTVEQATRQINTFNKYCNTANSLIQGKKDELRNDESSRRLPDTSSSEDTKQIVAAITHGKGLMDNRSLNTMINHPTRSDLPAVPTPISMSRAPQPNINMQGVPGKIAQVRPNVRMQPYQRM